MPTATDRVIDYTARRYESGPAGYAAYNPSDAGAGISFGFIQFNQVKGDLPLLFKEMQRRSPSQFAARFGSFAGNMLNESWVRTTDLAGNSDLIARLKASASVPEFQAAQREIAKRKFFDPIVMAVKAAGLKSERAYAMVYDTAVQRGPGTATRLVKQAASSGGTEKAILTAFASEADSVKGANNRRSQMLSDPGLSDTAFGVAFGGVALLAVGVGLWFFFSPSWRSHGVR